MTDTRASNTYNAVLWRGVVAAVMIALVMAAALILLMMNNVSAAEDSWQPAIVCEYESSCTNAVNFNFDTRHTAGGLFQITDTNWKHYARMADIDLARCPNALSCDAFSQGRVAGLMWHYEKYMPWTCCNAKLRQVLGETHRPGHAPPSAEGRQVASTAPAKEKTRTEVEERSAFFNAILFASSDVYHRVPSPFH